jgi:hypothetical protein
LAEALYPEVRSAMVWVEAITPFGKLRAHWEHGGLCCLAGHALLAVKTFTGMQLWPKGGKQVVVGSSR